MWRVFHSLGRVPSDGTSGACGDSVFNIRWTAKLVFGVVTPFTTSVSRAQGSASPVLTGTCCRLSLWWHPPRGWYRTVVLVCVFLMTDDVEHLFMCLLAIWVSSLEKHLFRPFAKFLIGLFIFLFGEWEFFLYSEYKAVVKYLIGKYFTSTLSFYFLICVLWSSKSFYFDASDLYNFSFFCLCFCCQKLPW